MICTEKENFCANCFRWIDSFCRVDKDELRPKDESDLSKFQNLTDGEVKDPHFQKCLLPHQKVVGKYIHTYINNLNMRFKSRTPL